MFVLSGKLIQQLFDYPFCLARTLSTKLSLRAVHCLCELWICRLYRLSSSPGRAERLLTPHSHPSIPLPPSLHPPVSCLLSAALRPCHLRDAPDHQGPGGRLGLANDGLHHGNNGERSCSVGEWCWRWLSGGEFFMLWTRQEGEGMITCGQALTFKIHRDAVALWPGDLLYGFSMKKQNHYEKEMAFYCDYGEQWTLMKMLHL